MQLGPVLPCAELRSGEDNGVELDVVLAHELVLSKVSYEVFEYVCSARVTYQLDIVRVLPPLLPLLALEVVAVGVVLGDGNVA